MSLEILNGFRHFLNHYAVWLLLLGLIQYGWHFYRQWKEEQNNFVQMQSPALLPPLEIWPDLPLVTVLVTAWNEEAYIEKFLRSFSDLDYPHKELIMVAGGNDHTRAVAYKRIDPQITILEQRVGEGKHRALQRCFQFASGRIIFLTDADCQLNSESFKRVIHPIIIGRESVVTGMYRPFAHQLSNPFVRAQWTKQRFWKVHPDAESYVPFILGRNAALTREHLEDGWDTSPNQPIGTDYYIALSLLREGYKILQARDSYVETRFAESITKYVRQQSRWNRSALLLHYQFGDKRWVRNVLSTLKFQLLLMMPCLPLLLGHVGSVVWLLSWAHFFAPYLRAKMRTVLLKERQKSTFLEMFQLMLVDFYAYAIILSQLLDQKQRERW